MASSPSNETVKDVLDNASEASWKTTSGTAVPAVIVFKQPIEIGSKFDFPRVFPAVPQPSGKTTGNEIVLILEFKIPGVCH